MQVQAEIDSDWMNGDADQNAIRAIIRQKEECAAMGVQFPAIMPLNKLSTGKLLPHSHNC